MKRQTLLINRSTPVPPTGRCFCLFDERHDLPPNSGPIFDRFNWQSNSGHYNQPNLLTALSALKSGQTVWLYATGLTAALTQFIGLCLERAGRSGSLVVLHYDHDRRTYFGNTVFTPLPLSP